MKNWMKIFVRSLLCLSLAIPAFTSCYDDSALWDKVNDMEARLNELEVEMTSQVEAMQALLSNGATLTSCKKNSDGSYTVTLSDGTKFKVLPEGTDFSSLVSVMVVDGKKCWATYDPSGNAVALTDASGKAIPVSVEVSVKIKDGVYCLVINGKEYETGYDAEDVVQVFSSCTPLTDASGNVYAVKFTFGEGMETTVALDGYKGVIFKLSSINNTVISEYYVDYGQTQSFLMDMQGVVDYVMQVPDGWRVKEVVEELTGETYLKVTAPSAETVALGAAVAEGDLKVVSVVEGGKAAISKIFLSTDPFKTYEVSALKAVIEPYTGIQKFAYGMMLTEEFDESQVVAKVNEILTSSTELPEGYFISEKVLDKTLAEIYGQELVSEISYVFWAVPVLYNEGTDEVEAGFYAEEEMLRTLVLNPMAITMKVYDITPVDANVSVAINGSDYAYAGVAEMTEDALEEIVYMVNNGVFEPTDLIQYAGSASYFPDGEKSINMNPDTEYIVWVIPVDEDKEAYAVSDLVYESFKTKAVVSGGSVVLSAGDLNTSASSISVSLEAEDAAIIYYTFMNDDDGKRYSTSSNETKMSKLCESESFVEVRDDVAFAEIKGLHPGSTYWLYAVAVGNDGGYGEVVCKSAETDEVSFNSLSLIVEEVSIKSDEATLKVTVSGGDAVDYIYWAGYEKDAFWSSSEFCDQSKTTAQKYMAANPDAEQITAVMRRNGAVSEDGTIKLNELSMSTNYVFLVLAKDAEGKFSKAGYKKFTTLAADFGDIVNEGTDKWNSQKKWIEDNIVWHQESFAAGAGNGQGSASYSFDIKIPKELKAYITCYGTESVVTEEIMQEIEIFCSSSWDRSQSIGEEEIPLPTWINEMDGREISTGGVFNYFVRYLHGEPDDGYVTYFSETGHDCIYMETGECSKYQNFKNSIEEKMSFDYWYEYIKYFANQEEYGRKQSDDSIIRKVAQEYADLHYKYFHDAEPIIYVNDGSALTITNRTAIGVDDSGKVVDKVTVVLVDSEGNYYEPMYIQVPNYFK